VHNAGVVPPLKASVMSALETGGYDWLHAAAHGDATNTGTAPLWLEQSEALTPDEIVGPGIEDHIRACRPGFVLNACDLGVAGWSLTGMSGWANQLIKVGAGMFLAPLWQVSDSVAAIFVKTFYEELARSERIADAMRTARQRARDVRGDPSWMAYVLYAHPNARVALKRVAPEEVHE
jgi:CHAT domain-containing protein